MSITLDMICFDGVYIQAVLLMLRLRAQYNCCLSVISTIQSHMLEEKQIYSTDFDEK